MIASDLIKAQLRLECTGLNDQGLLVRIDGPDPDEIVRYYVYRRDGGYERFFRHDVPAAIRAQILALPADSAFVAPEAIEYLLSRHQPSEGYTLGVSYLGLPMISPTDFSDVVRLTESDRSLIDHFDSELRASADRPVHAIVVDGRIVSACVSSRQNDEAGEAWVRTQPAFRRRGYARQVTASWAHHLTRQGKLAFYSHRIDNAASRSVAQSLGLQQFADYVNFG